MSPVDLPYRFFTEGTLATFRAAAACIVPADGSADGADSATAVRLADAVLAARPARDRRLFGTFLGLLEYLPVLRHGRRFSRLSPEQRSRFLEALESSSLSKLRQGFFGVKTFALLGHYGHESRFAELGYPGPRLDAPYYARVRS